jgi:predicted RNA-binding Zn-ribbon protein involved in translation (DUF1610 family)
MAWMISLKWCVEAGWQRYLVLEDGQIRLWEAYDPQNTQTRLCLSVRPYRVAGVYGPTYGLTMPIVDNFSIGIGDTGIFAIPLWIFLLPPLALAVFLSRRRRFPEHHCQSCGYDLTGNISGVCPECGTDVPVGIQEARSAEDEGESSSD